MKSLQSANSVRWMSVLAVALSLSLALAACGGGSGGTGPATPVRTRSEVVATVTVGPQPWGVAIKPDGTEAWVGNSGSGAGGGTVSVINLATRAVTATITSRANAADVVFNSTGTRAYVSNFGDASISEIDTSNYNVTLAPSSCGGPLAFARALLGNRLLYGCDSYLVTLDVITHSDSVYSFDSFGHAGDVIALPGTNIAVVARPWEGSLISVDSATGFRGTDPFGNFSAAGLQTLVLSPSGNLAMAGSTGAGLLTFFDVSNRVAVGTLTIGGTPRGSAFNPAGTKLYVVDHTGNRVVVVDVASRTVLETVSVGIGALRIAIAPDGLTAVVTHNNEGTVSILALAP